MYYTNYYWGMNFIWWILWIVMILWVFAVPYDIPGQRSKKDTPAGHPEKTVCFRPDQQG
ncbi:putative membrane protein [Flavobacterium noncentrifugens]|uniref:Putative membrane protein n=1 Tax=Flavobacterium noncentrifugens TaxID=1128970 RepID=A0A1G8WYA2_9FLAO|nr:putative membrane protein [Flavobacterium noncentrifugens]